MKTKLLILICLIANVAFAQRIITGVVSDKDSKPIDAVNVSIQGANQEVVTDAQGKYSIEVAAEFTKLVFKKTGYAEKVVEITSNELNVTMEVTADEYELSLEDLMNVEVTTAGKTSQKISEIPASVQVISSKDIEAYGYRDVQELLENTLGMYVTDDKFYFDAGINVRGFWSTQPSNIVILLNGVPQVQDKLSIYGLKVLSVPIGAIERVEIVRGPMSVVYGSGSFFGAINIITKSTENNSTVEVKYGSFNTKEAMVKFNSNSENLNLSFIANIEKANGEEFKYDDVIKDMTPYPLLKGKTIEDGFKHDKKSFTMTAASRGFYSQMSHVDYNDGVQVSPILPGPNNVIRCKETQTIASLGYQREINKWFSVDALGAYYDANTIRDNVFVFQANKPVFGDLKEYSRSTNLDLTLFLKPIKNLDITLGGSLKSVVENNIYLDIPSLQLPYTNGVGRLKDSSELQRYAGFTQVSYKPISWLTILGGLRLEQDSYYFICNNYGLGATTPAPVYLEAKVPESKLAYIPRFATIFSLSEAQVLKFMYGKASKLPTIQQNTDVLRGLLIPGSSINFLKAEEINTFELNYQVTLKSIWQVNASVFYSSMKNLIVRNLQSVGNTLVSTIANQGKLETTGGEASILVRPIDRLNLELSGMYQNTVDPDNESIDVSQSPHLLGYLKVKYDITPAGADAMNHVSIALIGNYVDKMYASWDVTPKSATDLTPKGRMGETTDAYFLLGMNLRADNLLTKGLFATFKVSNLLDTEYHIPTSTNSSWATLGMLGRGRFIQFGLGYKF